MRFVCHATTKDIKQLKMRPNNLIPEFGFWLSCTSKHLQWPINVSECFKSSQRLFDCFKCRAGSMKADSSCEANPI